MNQFFLYPFKYQVGKIDEKETSFTILFCEGSIGSKASLSTEIRQYYEQHEQTDIFIAIGAKDIASDLINAFDSNKEETFRYIPKSNFQNIITNTFVYSFDEFGNLSLIYSGGGQLREIPEGAINEGLLTIFKSRGGLIESNEGHHYVFPSGKHCSKFLRTGNILLHSAEIFFIAFSLLPYFSSERHSNIFCDTSSINSIAFALQDLKRRLIMFKGEKYSMVPMDSFSSYEGMVKVTSKRLEKSFILISASTSANILQRISKAHPILNKEDIKILFYLGPLDQYNDNKSQILCNLTKNDSNSNGIDIYTTYHSGDCALCSQGSFPVKINGDVFFPENPKVELLSINTRYVPRGLSVFMEQFQSTDNEQDHFIKVNYKENNDPELKYEIYLDMHYVFKSFKENRGKYSGFQQKLNDYINQYIPSNVRYLVCLPDEGSVAMAEYVLSRISENYIESRIPSILRFEETDLIEKSEEGSIVIIAACVAKGKNLLYLSRAFRQHDKLKLVYFIGISRMNNEQTHGFLKSNLKYGKYGQETYSYYVIESLNCNNEVKSTAWTRERNFMLKFQEFVNENYNDTSFYGRIQKRIEELENSVSNDQRGLANNLFFPSIFNSDPLNIRKNYAFLDYTNYHGHLSQADVYFTINSIIHKLRNNQSSPKMQQSEHVRVLLDPYNFNRFNDGIIQASFLRSCTINELCYHIDHNASIEMMGILETLIRFNNSEQGEALLEFLYALASGNLSIMDEHLQYICNLVEKDIKNEWAIYLIKYIKSTRLDESDRYYSQKKIIELQAEEIRSLKLQLANGQPG